MSDRATETDLPISFRRALPRDRSMQKEHAALTAELQAALAREQVLQQEKHELSQRQGMLTQEFEHRLINGLQLIVSLLSLQSRTATTPEAADQLTIGARRVASLGRVHRRLHLLDHQDHVEFKEYLQLLCDDLSGCCSWKAAVTPSWWRAPRQRSRPPWRSRSASSSTS